MAETKDTLSVQEAYKNGIPTDSSGKHYTLSPRLNWGAYTYRLTNKEGRTYNRPIRVNPENIGEYFYVLEGKAEKGEEQQPEAKQEEQAPEAAESVQERPAESATEEKPEESAEAEAEEAVAEEKIEVGGLDGEVKVDESGEETVSFDLGGEVIELKVDDAFKFTEAVNLPVSAIKEYFGVPIKGFAKVMKHLASVYGIITTTVQRDTYITGLLAQKITLEKGERIKTLREFAEAALEKEGASYKYKTFVKLLYKRMGFSDAEATKLAENYFDYLYEYSLKSPFAVVDSSKYESQSLYKVRGGLIVSLFVSNRVADLIEKYGAETVERLINKAYEGSLEVKDQAAEAIFPKKPLSGVRETLSEETEEILKESENYLKRFVGGKDIGIDNLHGFALFPMFKVGEDDRLTIGDLGKYTQNSLPMLIANGLKNVKHGKVARESLNRAVVTYNEMIASDGGIAGWALNRVKDRLSTYAVDPIESYVKDVVSKLKDNIETYHDRGEGLPQIIENLVELSTLVYAAQNGLDLSGEEPLSDEDFQKFSKFLMDNLNIPDALNKGTKLAEIPANELHNHVDMDSMIEGFLLARRTGNDVSSLIGVLIDQLSPDAAPPVEVNGISANELDELLEEIEVEPVEEEPKEETTKTEEQPPKPSEEQKESQKQPETTEPEEKEGAKEKSEREEAQELEEAVEETKKSGIQVAEDSIEAVGDRAEIKFNTTTPMTDLEGYGVLDITVNGKPLSIKKTDDGDVDVYYGDNIITLNDNEIEKLYEALTNLEMYASLEDEEYLDSAQQAITEIEDLIGSVFDKNLQAVAETIEEVSKELPKAEEAGEAKEEQPEEKREEVAVSDVEQLLEDIESLVEEGASEGEEKEVGAEEEVSEVGEAAQQEEQKAEEKVREESVEEKPAPTIYKPETLATELGQRIKTFAEQLAGISNPDEGKKLYEKFVDNLSSEVNRSIDNVLSSTAQGIKETKTPDEVINALTENEDFVDALTTQVGLQESTLNRSNVAPRIVEDVLTKLALESGNVAPLKALYGTNRGYIVRTEDGKPVYYKFSSGKDGKLKLTRIDTTKPEGSSEAAKASDWLRKKLSAFEKRKTPAAPLVEKILEARNEKFDKNIRPIIRATVLASMAASPTPETLKYLKDSSYVLQPLRLAGIPVQEKNGRFEIYSPSDMSLAENVAKALGKKKFNSLGELIKTIEKKADKLAKVQGISSALPQVVNLLGFVDKRLNEANNVPTEEALRALDVHIPSNRDAKFVEIGRTAANLIASTKGIDEHLDDEGRFAPVAAQTVEALKKRGFDILPEYDVSLKTEGNTHELSITKDGKPVTPAEFVKAFEEALKGNRFLEEYADRWEALKKEIDDAAKAEGGYKKIAEAAQKVGKLAQMRKAVNDKIEKARSYIDKAISSKKPVKASWLKKWVNDVTEGVIAEDKELAQQIGEALVKALRSSAPKYLENLDADKLNAGDIEEIAKGLYYYQRDYFDKALETSKLSDEEKKALANKFPAIESVVPTAKSAETSATKQESKREAKEKTEKQGKEREEKEKSAKKEKSSEEKKKKVAKKRRGRKPSKMVENPAKVTGEVTADKVKQAFERMNVLPPMITSYLEDNGVDVEVLKRGEASEDDLKVFKEALEKFGGTPIFYDDVKDLFGLEKEE